MEDIQMLDNSEDSQPKKGRGQYERKPRGSYQKQNIDKKITIKYFPNKRLKPLFYFDNIPNYPIYLQVSLKGQTTFLPAPIQDKYDLPPQNDKELLEDFLDMYKEENEELILKIINSLEPFQRDEFSISEFAIIYKVINLSVSKLIKQLLVEEINRLINKQPTDLLNPYFARVLNNISETEDLQAHFKRLQILPDKVNTLLEFGEDIWSIEHFEAIKIMRDIRRNYNNPTSFSTTFIGVHYPEKMEQFKEQSYTLLSFLEGRYQKLFIEEFGDRIMTPIFSDINKILSRYFTNFNNIIKIFTKY